MAVEITIRIPDALEQQLQNFRDRLPEVLELGLRQLMAERSEGFQDENVIMELLASGPTPEQVLAIRPSRELQARVSDLLSRSKAGGLSIQEEVELERYLTLEHLVRLAKAHAHRQLAKPQ